MFCRHICLKIWQPSGIIVGKHFSCYIIKCKYFAITGYFFFSFFFTLISTIIKKKTKILGIQWIFNTYILKLFSNLFYKAAP